MLHSAYRPLCGVMLPFRNRQMYMHTFDLANPVMAEGYEDYLDPVQRLCEAAGAIKGQAHMTVDEKVVLRGETQRKPFAHVDGCFYPELNHWGGGGGGWNHYCNNVPLKRMAVIVAANRVGCRAWKGEFDGDPKEGGDCRHLVLDWAKPEVMFANMGYLFSPDCVHESMPMEYSAPRTFLRIALPTDFQYQ